MDEVVNGDREKEQSEEESEGEGVLQDGEEFLHDGASISQVLASRQRRE